MSCNSSITFFIFILFFTMGIVTYLKGVLVLKGASDITACQCLALLSTAWQCLALLSTSGLLSGGASFKRSARFKRNFRHNCMPVLGLVFYFLSGKFHEKFFLSGKFHEIFFFVRIFVRKISCRSACFKRNFRHNCMPVLGLAQYCLAVLGLA